MFWAVTQELPFTKMQVLNQTLLGDEGYQTWLGERLSLRPNDWKLRMLGVLDVMLMANHLR